MGPVMQTFRFHALYCLIKAITTSELWCKYNKNATTDWDPWDHQIAEKFIC